jgi:hypothetical protein
MENMKFMETDEDKGSKIRGLGYTIVIIHNITTGDSWIAECVAFCGIS